MKIHFASLGCDKNLVDTEHMLGILAEQDLQIAETEESAEIIVAFGA